MRNADFSLSSERFPDEKKNISIVSGLSAARTRAGSDGHDGPQGADEHHDDVVAYDDGVRAADRGLRDQYRNNTFGILKATKECVINIPAVELAAKVVSCGNTSGQSVDKFKVFRLTPEPASLVAAPLIAECYVNLECKVVDTRMVTKYNFFILEVIKAWIDPSKKPPRTIHHLGRGAFMVAGKTITLPSKMKQRAPYESK